MMVIFTINFTGLRITVVIGRISKEKKKEKENLGAQEMPVNMERKEEVQDGREVTQMIEYRLK